MNKLYTLPIIIAIAMFSTACNKSSDSDEAKKEADSQPAVSKHEEIANKIMDSMEEMANAARSVTDMESAKKASEKINAIADRFSGYAEELKAIDPPTEELKAKITKKMEERQEKMEQLMGEEFETHMEGLESEVRQVLEEAFGEFFGKMMENGKVFEKHFEPDEEAGGVSE